MLLKIVFFPLYFSDNIVFTNYLQTSQSSLLITTTTVAIILVNL